jgi:hypothetical protein
MSHNTGSFNDVIELVEVKRAIVNNRSVYYLAFLDRLRDGECTEEDWRHVVETETCSKDSMPAIDWE